MTLDPDKRSERERKVVEAKKKYNEEYGDLDIKKAYENLFEILWYSQLPCFDVRNITSEFKDEMSLIKRCYWKGQKMRCSSIFLTRPTDRGMCCTFNMEKAEHIFRKSKYASALSSLQKQDLENSLKKENLKNLVQQERIHQNYIDQKEPKTQPGQNKGLRLILDAHTDRVAPGTVSDNFRGFSTVIDGRDKYPLTSKNSFLIRPGRENYVALSALRVEADINVQKIHPRKRKCYFSHENPLVMHKNYSRSNCVLECTINYARKEMKKLNESKSNETVGCAPWFYPATDEEYTNVCDPWETKTFQTFMTNVPDIHFKMYRLRCSISADCDGQNVSNYQVNAIENRIYLSINITNWKTMKKIYVGFHFLSIINRDYMLCKYLFFN